MVWAKLDDEILDNTKIVAAGVLGFALHVAAITWCCRNLTDGFIPRAKARLLLDFSGLGAEIHHAIPGGPGAMKDQLTDAYVEAGGVDADEVAEQLIGVGLWTKDKDRDGYWLKDFLEYNPSRERVLGERERARKKKSDHPAHAPPSPKPGANLARSSAEPPPNLDRISDGPVPVPVPVPIEPPRGGSPARARGVTGPESESRTRVADGAVTLRGNAPLEDDARTAWETATFNRKPPDTPIEAVWVKFCGQNAGAEYPSRERLVGKFQKFVADECGYSEGRRIKAQEARDRFKDHTPKHEQPTAQQSKDFQAELTRRLLEDEAKKKGAA